MAKGTVPKRELTPTEKAAAERLKAAWDSYRSQNKGATQAWLGSETKLGNQSLMGQYLGGVIPLNHKALLAICKAISVDPTTISAELTETLPTKKFASLDPSHKTALVYVDAEELQILTHYREATHRGKKIILSAAVSAEKK